MKQHRNNQWRQENDQIRYSQDRYAVEFDGISVLNFYKL